MISQSSSVHYLVVLACHLRGLIVELTRCWGFRLWVNWRVVDGADLVVFGVRLVKELPSV